MDSVYGAWGTWVLVSLVALLVIVVIIGVVVTWGTIGGVFIASISGWFGKCIGRCLWRRKASPSASAQAAATGTYPRLGILPISRTSSCHKSMYNSPFASPWLPQYEPTEKAQTKKSPTGSPKTDNPYTGPIASVEQPTKTSAQGSAVWQTIDDAHSTSSASSAKVQA